MASNSSTTITHSPDWRDAILNDFVPNVSKLTLVADPDGLLTEEKLLLQLRERGFALIEFTDPVEFRYAYECQYRSLWDRGEQTDLVVVLRLQNTELDCLPYDLLQAGRRLSFNLGELFPKLSYPVIEQLDRRTLDCLYDAQCTYQPEHLGDNATKDFILRHVFGIAAELITNDVGLLHMLLRVHYGKLQLPQVLAERLIQNLNAHGQFKAWPLSEIILDDAAFYSFLQERWPLFLDRLGKANSPGETSAKKDQIQDDGSEYGLKFLGPAQLPFDHQDIKVYIDNLFLERKLTPVKATGIELGDASWIRSGIATSSMEDDQLRITGLFDLVENSLPARDAGRTDWTAFALKWAELSSLIHSKPDAESHARQKAFGKTVNATFADWLSTHYSSLISLPPSPPAMLHHVPRRLARDMEDSSTRRVALIVLDGMALDQWVPVRQYLQSRDARLTIREFALFAWIPTLTSVSRQSLFAGKQPFFFPSSIKSTDYDGKLWKQFWEEHGVPRTDVIYQRGLGEGNAADILDSAHCSDKTKVVGLVVDKVDAIMHGMTLGSTGMHNQIKLWLQMDFLAALVEQLLDRGFDVWLTADHGNIECVGRGSPKEGSVAETRGERVRVYPTKELREQISQAFPTACKWEPVGLPDEYYPLLADGYNAFTTEGTTTVCHGGIAIEEVIVPLVKLERAAR